MLTHSAEQTEALGRRLGACLRAGDVVLVTGDLGAGKTVLVKGIASAFGLREREITSASFTIVAEYPTEPPFYHIDLYRLQREADIEAAGVYEYMEGRGVAVVEWAERLGATAPEGAVRVDIKVAGEVEREIVVRGAPEGF